MRKRMKSPGEKVVKYINRISTHSRACTRVTQVASSINHLNKIRSYWVYIWVDKKNPKSIKSLIINIL